MLTLKVTIYLMLYFCFLLHGYVPHNTLFVHFISLADSLTSKTIMVDTFVKEKLEIYKYTISHIFVTIKGETEYSILILILLIIKFNAFTKGNVIPNLMSVKILPRNVCMSIKKLCINHSFENKHNPSTIHLK